MRNDRRLIFALLVGTNDLNACQEDTKTNIAAGVVKSGQFNEEGDTFHYNVHCMSVHPDGKKVFVGAEIDTLSKYVATRTAVFDARRSGSAVVSVTVEGDTQSVLRFFGFLQRTNRTPEGACFYLSSFLVRSDLGNLVQAYAERLRSNQQLRYGSIANS